MSPLGRFGAGVAIVAAFVVAGCLDNSVTVGNDAQEAPSEPRFFFASKNCYEAGFQAVYSGQRTLANFWVTADAQKEYGDPILDSSRLQLPVIPPASANVHNGFKCETTDFNGTIVRDFMFGFVGDPIIPPAFDPGGADLTFLISFISLQNGTLYDAMDAMSTARISRTIDSSIQFLSGTIDDERFRVHEEFRTTDNGIYEGTSDMTKYRDVPERTIRFWWTVPSDGSESKIGAHEGHDEEVDAEALDWNPIYWDLKTSGGPQWTTPQYLGNNEGCHAGIDDHGPGGRLCQPTQTSIYHHDEITFEMGPVLKDVVLPDYWFH